MKKKILGGIIIATIVAITAFNINFNTEKGDKSLLTLANIEALAQGESEWGCDGHPTWLPYKELNDVKCPWQIWKTHKKCEKTEDKVCCDPDKQTSC